MNPFHAVAAHMSEIRNIRGVYESVNIGVSLHALISGDFSMCYVTWPRWKGGCANMDSTGATAKHFGICLLGRDIDHSYLLHAVVLENPMGDRHHGRRLLRQGVELDMNPVPDTFVGMSLVLVEPLHPSHARALVSHRCRVSITVNATTLTSWELKLSALQSCVAVADSFWSHFHPSARWSRLRDRMKPGTTIKDVLSHGLAQNQADEMAFQEVTMEDLVAAAWDVVDAGEGMISHDGVEILVAEGHEKHAVLRLMDVANGDVVLARSLLAMVVPRGTAEKKRMCECLGAGAGHHRAGCTL